MEHLRDLRQQGDARVHGHRFALEPLRLASTIPMLVQRRHCLRRHFGQPQPPHDVGAPVTAGLDEFGDERGGVAHDVEDRACPCPVARAGRGLGQHVAQGVGERGADGAEVALQLEIVGTVDFAQARRVAGTPRVLEQHGVEQVSLGLCGDAEFVGAAKRDVGGARRMPGREPLGHVEGMAHRAKQLGQGHGLACAWGDVRHQTSSRCTSIDMMTDEGKERVHDPEGGRLPATSFGWRRRAVIRASTSIAKGLFSTCMLDQGGHG